MPKKFDHESLKHWFLQEQRDLPWRHNPTPYSVWVSEVMLQQTQVSVVIPYFERWMKRFPTIHELANAKLDEVIKLWEGLGYYSRARNLLEGARYVLENYHGNLPSTADELKKIKGLGPYTIGAILSFAFHKRTSAVDGNVIRVLCRYYQVAEDIAKPKTIEKIRKLADSLLPEEEPWIINEALIELGATICSKKAKCQTCPLNRSCSSYIQRTVEELPFKSQKIQTQKLFRTVAVLEFDKKILVKRGKKGEIMSDLHEFPYFETNSAKALSKKDLQSKLESWNLKVSAPQKMPIVKHSFTRYQVQLTPIYFKCQTNPIIDDYLWLTYEELNQLAFSSGHRRIFEMIKERIFS